MNAATALAVASGLHLGFQVTVTLLVYPAFSEVPVEQWRRYHTAHSRRITPVVALVYAAVTASVVWVVASGPARVSGYVAVAASAAAVAVTALVAAPAHGRLSQVREGRDLTILLAADRVRLACAVVAAAAALLPAQGS